MHKIHMLPDPSSHDLIKRLLCGVRRGRTFDDSRHPITGNILLKLIEMLPSVTASRYESCMFKAAFSLAFFGFLRLGEFTSYSKKPQAEVTLLSTDVSVSRAAGRRVVVVQIRRSKNNQHGPAQQITIPSGRARYRCPVQAVVDYITARPQRAQAFLCHYDLTPLTRREFQRVLRKVAAAAGLREGHLTPHSFRIGAATEAASLGYSEVQIQSFGRWRSAAYRSYIRPPTGVLASDGLML
jgi:integrase